VHGISVENPGNPENSEKISRKISGFSEKMWRKIKISLFNNWT
jgi:hypothetical protein